MPKNKLNKSYATRVLYKNLNGSNNVSSYETTEKLRSGPTKSPNYVNEIVDPAEFQSGTEKTPKGKKKNIDLQHDNYKYARTPMKLPPLQYDDEDNLGHNKSQIIGPKRAYSNMQSPIRQAQQNNIVNTSQAKNYESHQIYDFYKKNNRPKIPQNLLYQPSNNSQHENTIHPKQKQNYSQLEEQKNQLPFEDTKSHLDIITNEQNSKKDIVDEYQKDWAESILYWNVKNGITNFNNEREDDIYYDFELETICGTLRGKSKGLVNMEDLFPFYSKAKNTLQKLTNELLIGHFVYEFGAQTTEVNINLNIFRLILNQQ